MIRDVLIVGAGPSGLAAAIALKQLGLDYMAIEKASLVDSIRRFPVSLEFHTPSELLEIGGIPFTTAHRFPTRLEALRYYRRVTDTFQLQVSLREEVLGIERDQEAGETIFLLDTRTHLGVRRVRMARAVVLAMGGFALPNLLDIPGEDLPHVSHSYGESHPYYRQRVVVVGGGDSAVEAALDLQRNGAQVTLVHRRSTVRDSVRPWLRADLDTRMRDGVLAARFDARVVAIRPTEVVVAVTGIDAAERTESWPAEAVLLLTGSRADPEFLRRAGVTVSEQTLEPACHPESCETNVPNLFLAGRPGAGVRIGANSVETGRIHAERIARILAARFGQTI